MTEPDVCPACPVASSLRYRITGVRHALNHSLKIDLNTKQLAVSLWLLPLKSIEKHTGGATRFLKRA